MLTCGGLVLRNSTQNMTFDFKTGVIDDDGWTSGVGATKISSIDLGKSKPEESNNKGRFED